MFIIYLYLEVSKVLKALALLHFSYYQVALIRKWECRTWKICQIGVIDHWSAAKTEIWSEFSKTFIEYLFSSNLSFIFTKEVWSTILLLLESGAVHSFIHCTPSYSLITLLPSSTTHPTPIPGSYSCAVCFRLVRGNNRVFASLIMYQATEHIVIGSDDSPGTADTGSHGGNLLGVWSVAVLSSGILMETEIFRKIPFLPSGGL